MRVPFEIVHEVNTFLYRDALIVGAAMALPIAIRDQSDVPVLAETVAGGAEILVTGNLDLLDITDQLPIRILTPRGLWELLRSSTNLNE